MQAELQRFPPLPDPEFLTASYDANRHAPELTPTSGRINWDVDDPNALRRACCNRASRANVHGQFLKREGRVEKYASSFVSLLFVSSYLSLSWHTRLEQRDKCAAPCCMYR